MADNGTKKPDGARNVDLFNRRINYLRVSVTDRCNLRCFYCGPAHEPSWVPHAEILSYEEILRVVGAGARLGIKKVRVTGGEPLVRRGIIHLISEIAAIPGIEDVALTTNGVLLAGMARSLAEAGLARVNVSLDSLDPAVFSRVTGSDRFHDVLEGLDAALSAGLSPVKINVVALAGINGHEVESFAALTMKKPFHVRFIEFMPVGGNTLWRPDMVLPAHEIIRRLEAAAGPLIPIQGQAATEGPARRFRFAGAKGEVGFISAVTGHFCLSCNRMRMTADGRLRPCLFSDKEWNIKGLLRSGASDEQVQEFFRQAIQSKPQGHGLSIQASNGHGRSMSSIGG